MAVFQTAPARQYLQSVDLGIGADLYRRCRQIFSEYHQIIGFRKRFIVEQAENLVREHGIAQVVILAAGLDPLGLELSHLYPQLPIFELDREHLAHKEQFIARLGLTHNIRFVKHDLTEGDLLARLQKAGYQPELPTVVVLEGITYYLSPATLNRIIATFARPNSFYLMDWLLAKDAISQTAFQISEAVFGTIVDTAQIYRFAGPHELQNLGLKPLKIGNTYDLEKHYTDKNALFKTKKDAWIELALCQKLH